MSNPSGWGIDLDSKNGIIAIAEGSYGAYPIATRVWSFDVNTGNLIAKGDDIGVYSSENPSKIIVDDGKAYFHFIDGRTRAVSLTTGKVVWTSERGQEPWDIIGTYGGISAAYGNIYLGTQDGYVYCYNAETGKEVWKFFCGNTTEVAFGTYVPFSIRVMADGKVYTVTGEHTPPNPMPRGNKLLCLDAFTGELVWSYPFMSQYEATMGLGISSGMFWAINAYDDCLYMFGKGESATTVSVQQDVIASGASVLIQGTVTDQSAGAKDTPAIADASMTQWMEYLYMGWPMPTNATGVSVFLQAMRSDGSVIDVAHVTSDIMGHYEFPWTPPDQDTYKVLATFEGSESYWSSSGITSLSVGAAAPAPAALEGAPDNTYTIVGTGIAVIIAVAIVGVLLLRKRP